MRATIYWLPASTRQDITPIKYTANKRKMNDLATDNEIGQMRSVIGSLGGSRGSAGQTLVTQ